jgi:ubiquinone/menaquinone biosynthesis C-methylase UbiE
MTKDEEAAWFLRVLELAGHPISPGVRVLDFGCGDLVQALTDRYDAFGCDIVLDHEDERLRRIEQDPVYRLPFDDASCDCVLSQQVFEHVQDYNAVLIKLRRILKPGGVSLHIFPLGITRWWHSRISNGLLEGLHSLVQAAKRRARGYRSTRNYIAMIHLTAGKLDVAVTHTK